MTAPASVLELPAVARAAVDAGQLVSRPGSTVVHVASAGRRQVTPGGRLTRATRPSCGQRGRAWRLTAIDGRRLCARCLAHLVRTSADPSAALRRLTEDDLRSSLTTCRDPRALHLSVLALCASPVRITRLQELVRQTRHRLELQPARAFTPLPRRERTPRPLLPGLDPATD